MFLISLVLLSAILSCKGQSVYKEYHDCGISFANQNRIVGGNKTYQAEFPWLVSLQYNSNSGWRHMCGATILTEEFALTAAHCFMDTGTKSPHNWRVVAGEYSLSQKDGSEKVIRVKSIISHALFDTLTNQNDIAVLKLSEPVTPYSHLIAPVCLPKRDYEIPARSPVVVAGWGSLTFDGPVSDKMRKVNVYTFNTERCAKVYQLLVVGADVVPEAMMCAGDIRGGRDACQGDSGGPLMEMDRQGRATQVGVVSFGASCGRPLLAGVYTKVSNYIDWIEYAIENSATTFTAGYLPFLTCILVFALSSFRIQFQ